MSISHTITTLRAAGLSGLALASVTTSAADDVFWNGGDGLWTDENWDPFFPIGSAGDHAFIEDGKTTIQTGMDASAGAVIVRNGGALEITGGALDLPGGDYFGVHLAVGDFEEGPGTLTMTGGSINAHGGRISVGFDQASQGTATISGGSITHSNEFWVGQSVGSNGILTLSGTAQITGTSWFAVGREGGNGNLTVKDNAVINKSNGGNFKIAGDTGSIGTTTVEGSGKITSAGTLEIGVGSNTNGTLTIKDTATVEVPGGWTVMGGGGCTATLNLDGGFLRTNWIGDFGGTLAISFNGGTLVAQEGGTSYLSGFDASELHIQPGGFRFDSNGYAVTIVQGLSGNGPLTKLGEGTLNLTGAGTYTGNTTVTGGTLVLGQDDVLADTSTVTLVTSGSLVLAHAGIDVVQSLVINGVTQPVGLYTFTSGQLQVTGATTDPFTTWATAKGLDGTPGKENGPMDDPDKDGHSNLLEFAFNGNPLGASDRGNVHVMTADSDWAADPSTASELILTIAVRTGTPAFGGGSSPSAVVDGISYTIEGSLTLSGFPLTVHPVAAITTGLPAAGTGYEYRSFSLEGSDALTGKGFLRAKVVK